MVTPQELNLRLLELTSFNELDGKKVAKDLRANRKLWRGAVLTRLEDLICLRDIEEKFWNVDTLFILAKEGYEDELEKLAKTWNADELDWCSSAEAMHLLGFYSAREDWSKKLLRVWWD